MGKRLSVFRNALVEVFVVLLLIYFFFKKRYGKSVLGPPSLSLSCAVAQHDTIDITYNRR